MEEESFVPSCYRCAYYAEFGLETEDTMKTVKTMKIVFLSRPEKGLGSKPGSVQPNGWSMGVCCYGETGHYQLIQEMRTFGSPCGPMGRLYEERAS